MSWLSTYHLTDDMELTGINVDIAQELVLLWGKCSDKKQNSASGKQWNETELQL